MKYFGVDFVETTGKVCNDFASENKLQLWESINKRETVFKKSLSTFFQRMPQHHKGFVKERLLLASKRDELSKVQTQMSTKHFYSFLRFELRAPLYECALLKAIMNLSSHFHRHTHSSDLNYSWCRTRS